MANYYRVFCLEKDTLPEKVQLKKHYPGFAIVEADEEDIEVLKKIYPVEGIKFLKTKDRLGAFVSEFSDRLLQSDSTGRKDIIIKFNVPVNKELTDTMKEIGVTKLGALGDFSLAVSCSTGDIVRSILDMPEVSNISSYIPDLKKISPEFFEKLSDMPEVNRKDKNSIKSAINKISLDMKRGDVNRERDVGIPGVVMANFFKKDDRDKAKENLEREDKLDIISIGDKCFAVDLRRAGIEGLLRIVYQPGVKSIEDMKMNKVFNNVARKIIGEGVVDSGTGLTGKGEIIAIADTGLDTGDPDNIHLDFYGKIKSVQSFPINVTISRDVDNPGGDDGPADLYSGHGTHVAGSALGNGIQSIACGVPSIQGMAPDATLVFQAVEQTPKWKPGVILEYLTRRQYPPNYGLYGIPEELKVLFQPAYDQGARIHSNSWGGGNPGEYRIDSEQLDEFVWRNKDFLVVVAAGNEGVDTDRTDKAVDLMSISSPGTAKNCLTVGACENLRSEFTSTYNFENFPYKPFVLDSKSDSEDDIVAFSSRGPCKTGRRKPDVIAPGTYILSTRSSMISHQTVGWGRYEPAKDYYMFYGGTSMATPLAAGSAAIVRQYLRSFHGGIFINPSAALLKAAIIHSAKYINYRYAHPGSFPWADNEQGWGRVCLKKLINPLPDEQIMFVDEKNALKTGDYRDYEFEVGESSVKLRVTMVYTDYPGENLINNLNLFVISPDKKYYIGNDFKGKGETDCFNNVEGVVIEKPQTGKWIIRVIASEIQKDLQDFALVISGGVKS